MACYYFKQFYLLKYIHFKTKIDYIFVTQRLLSSVRACSILPLQDGYLSDHRALVVDFEPMGLFGEKTSAIVPPATRLLTSTNPRAVHKYIEHMRKHLDTHRINEKIEKLKCSKIDFILSGFLEHTQMNAEIAKINF